MSDGWTREKRLRDVRRLRDAAQKEHDLLEARHGGERAGYVYFIENGTGHVKIGRSRDPEKRLRRFLTGNSSPLRLLHIVQTDDMHATERVFHDTFSREPHKRAEGEWFEIDRADSMFEYIMGIGEYVWVDDYEMERGFAVANLADYDQALREIEAGE